MSEHRILFVDDEPNVLSAIRRGLRNDFSVETAPGPLEALEILKSQKFSVIVSDCRMPEMDGVELLGRIAKIAPDSTRVMLTGNTDQGTAVRAVNQGEVFKFVNKPCETEQLRKTLRLAIRQYELVTAERELLVNTVNGSIKVLADVLSIARPDAFGRTSRIRRIAESIGTRIEGTNAWLLDSASLLSQLGCISVSEDILERMQKGDALNSRQEQEFNSHPELGAELIGKIPRLEQVARAIQYQFKQFDGGGQPADDVKGQDIPLEARILHLASVVDTMREKNIPDSVIVEDLQGRRRQFDPVALDAFIESIDLDEGEQTVRRVKPEHLRLGMIIQEDIRNARGAVLICRGQEITTPIREHLRRFQANGTLTDAVLVEFTGAEPAADDDEREAS